MENEEIIKVLESIGLHKNEIAVYLDLIRIGKSSALDIAKRTGIHRSNVYDTVEKLIEKGLVAVNVKENRKVFYPVEPKSLLNYLKQKEYDVKKILPKIEEIKRKQYEERKIILLEGVPPLRSILSDFLKMKKPISALGVPKDIPEILGGFLIEFHNERIKKKIPMKIIFNSSSEKRIREINKMEFTEARFLPSVFDSKVTTDICGNKVVFVFWETPISVALIEDKDLAEAYQKYFDIIWESAKLTY